MNDWISEPLPSSAFCTFDEGLSYPSGLFGSSQTSLYELLRHDRLSFSLILPSDRLPVARLSCDLPVGNGRSQKPRKPSPAHDITFLYRKGVRPTNYHIKICVERVSGWTHQD